MTYTPRTGSVADRAHQMLTARGKLSAAALADAIDHDDVSTLMPCLQIALREGYIKKTRSEGLIWYQVGDGVPLVPVDAEPDEHPVVQRVVSAGSRPKIDMARPSAVPAKVLAKVDAKPPVVKKGSPPVQTPASADAVRFTVERETRLVIERGDQRLVLSKADVGRLRGVIEDQVL